MLSGVLRLMAMVSVVLAMAAVAGEALAQELISRLEFRDAYAARVEKAIPGVKIVRKGESELQLTLPDGRTMTAFLDNAYADYRKDPTDLDELLGRHARSIVAASQDRPLVAERLVVIVRHEDFVAHGMDLSDLNEGDVPITRPIGGGLIAIIAQDEPESVSMPPRSTLVERFGNEDRIWALALANTPRFVGELQVERLGDSSILLVAGQPSYAPSLLVLDQWNSEALAGEGNPVVIVVDRDIIIVTRDRDPETLLAMGRVLEGLRQDGTPAISDAVLVLKNGEWIEVELD